MQLLAIVEQEQLRERLERRVVRSGHNCRAATDEQELAAAVAGGNYDAVLLVLDGAERLGYWALQEVLRGDPDIDVVLLSSAWSRQDERLIFGKTREGLYCCLPFDGEALSGALRRMEKRLQLRNSAAAELAVVERGEVCGCQL